MRFFSDRLSHLCVQSEYFWHDIPDRGPSPHDRSATAQAFPGGDQAAPMLGLVRA